ncbi:beta-L-arabinofuranosidase domain-containing protein [Streptomyces sp. NPDC051555]|uniref:beta-L-arabinofuranosidase domain-containing protein n=1 Tax=Streptomyces sp. NPDC051555 TaxID=3365657 RepID=UPI0037A6A835
MNHPEIDLEQRVDTYKAASSRGAQQLASSQRPDGSLPSSHDVIESSYKGIWALQCAGRTVEAARLASYVRAHLGADGSVPSPREEAYFLDVHYLYANGYLAIGTHLLGQFDLSDRLMSFIASMQNPQHGGFRSTGPLPGDGRCDTVSTSISGIAALFHGRQDVALRAAGFLAAVWKAQPERASVFFSTTSADGELRTGAGVHQLKVQEPGQDWWFLGAPAVFLTALHEKTGDAQHLELARELMDYMAQSCHRDVALHPSCGKLGVSAAMLYRLTGERQYADLAVRIADLIVGNQDPKGVWTRDMWFHDTAWDGTADLLWSDLDMSLEYVLWLDLIARELTSAGA